MTYNDKEAISFSDVAIVTQYSSLDSRSDVDITTKLGSSPLVGSPMYHLGTVDMAKFFSEKRIPFVLHRYFPNVLKQIEMYDLMIKAGCLKHLLYVSVGSNLEWIEALRIHGVTHYCVDMANGNSKQCVKSVKLLNDWGRVNPSCIMAGNIETVDGFFRLYDAGARHIRVGIGSGSICSTSINTGYGLPILSALNDIRTRMPDDINKDVNLIADGGIRTAGDIAKALAFGAKSVMCGKIFAATDLARGPFFDEKIRIVLPAYAKYVEYAGMASTMMRELSGSQKTDVSEEGKSGLIEYAGPTSTVYSNLCLNLMAVLAYSGAKNIPEFVENAIIQRVSAGGKIEKAIHLDKIYR